MKATIDIPDELYRQVKARSTPQGKAVREVTVERYERWLAGERCVCGSRTGSAALAPRLAACCRRSGPGRTGRTVGPHRTAARPRSTGPPVSLLVVDASVWVGAADASDPSSADSRAFPTALAARQVPIALPTIARIEVACALAQRLRDNVAAQRLADALLASSPQVRERPLDADLVRKAVTLGTQAFLRGADAIYAALTARLGATLIAWDDEPVQRAGAVTPTTRLAKNP